MSPGSTFKMMSTMALLELGKATINTRVDVPSSAVDTVGRKRVSDTHVLRDEDGNVIWPEVHVYWPEPLPEVQSVNGGTGGFDVGVSDWGEEIVTVLPLL
jgi:cell division protein FtsI/penicillin-binding protein 2